MDIKSFLNPDRVAQWTETGLGLAMNVLAAIVILIIGLWIAKRVSNGIIKMSKKYDHLDDTLFRFLASIVKFLILAVVGMAVLGRFGVETTSIVAVLGAATVAIGLALQGSLSNLAAGVMLLIFRPYKVGDFIDGGGSFGNVEEINLFTTNMQTFDNQQIIIPPVKSSKVFWTHIRTSNLTLRLSSKLKRSASALLKSLFVPSQTARIISTSLTLCQSRSKRPLAKLASPHLTRKHAS